MHKRWQSINFWFPSMTSQVAQQVKNPLAIQEMRLEFHPLAGKILWSRKWQHTPVVSPGESHGQRSLAGLQSIGSPNSWTRLKRLSMLPSASHPDQVKCAFRPQKLLLKNLTHKMIQTCEEWTWSSKLLTANESQSQLMKIFVLMWIIKGFFRPHW